MIPVVTPEEMAAVDRQAPEPVEVLVERAGSAVARAALDLLGGTYGRRVVLVAGRGNNGNDGRAAARRLAARGVRVVELAAGDLEPGAPLPPSDLIVDAAYGNGLARPYSPPEPDGTPVLAVDIPSGLSGETGEVLAGGGALEAVATVTFAALKPGLLLHDGPTLAGDVTLADIGLGSLAEEHARAHLVGDDAVARLLPRRGRDAQKWQTALGVVSGSPGMTGAPWMVSRAALRAGAGYVRLGLPGVDPGQAGLPPSEVVMAGLPRSEWETEAAEWVSRCRAFVVGPGLGDSGPSVGRLLAATSIPAVVDADGLNALGNLAAVRKAADARDAPLVLTPHDGEFARLTGSMPPPDRPAAARAAAEESGAVVLLKGSTTVVAEPGGRVLFATAGTSRLASAGTGDALSGVLGAFLARGTPAFEAAALAAHVHGRAAELGLPEGLIASDLPDLVARVLSRIAR